MATVLGQTLGSTGLVVRLPSFKAELGLYPPRQNLSCLLRLWARV
jgi:hypothetical protein